MDALRFSRNLVNTKKIRILMSWVVTLTLASHSEPKFLLEEDSNLDYSVGPRCPELGNFSIWQSSPISLKQVLLLVVFPCTGPSLSTGNFLLFDPGPGFGPCSETATVSSPF